MKLLKFFCLLMLLLISATSYSAEGVKQKIGIMEFDVRGKLDPSFGPILYDMLLQQMVVSGKYIVVDWEEIDRMLKYIANSQKNISSDEAKKQAVDQLGIQKMYVGSVSKMGSKYYISIKVLNLDLTVEKVVKKSTKSEDELESVIGTLASQLLNTAGKDVDKLSQTVDSSGKYHLTVEPTPEDARIRILNIVPKYRHGMELEAGSYHIEVSKQGFATVKKWVNLKGSDLNVAITLQKNGGKGSAARKLPYFLAPVTTAKYAPIQGLADGSRAARERQKKTVNSKGFPLEVKTRKTGIYFRLIPAGTYMMGSPSSESGRASDEGPLHQVTISKPFYISKYEITQAQWEAVMGSNPSRFTNSGKNAPVEQVSWHDCQEFILMLRQKEGSPARSFRLPTEAEWEYASRAGTISPYAGDIGFMGWYDGNSSGRTHEVGQKKPNAWGLFDMHGNVWEWCRDWYKDSYASGDTKDPTGPQSGSERVDRGGGWSSSASSCRSAFRNGRSPGYRGFYLGFRLVVPPGQ
ncbi:MAG: formylglycine-generating enzyme family protein [bacterium]|nr:formylglycine-generating enzyme family protein [bacterium]